MELLVKELEKATTSPSEEELHGEVRTTMRTTCIENRKIDRNILATFSGQPGTPFESQTRAGTVGLLLTLQPSLDSSDDE
jgi:hypothetical protein